MAKEKEQTRSPISEAAAAMGRKGGPARAKKLSAKRRKEIAKEGAQARWGKKAVSSTSSKPPAEES
jgi:hypothetical protein